ncbi:adenylate cyclase type 3-like [Thrips palmi]|uniref:adenylate cyclase n=1 Tax=Thrips palmi TaxID=161013 RepID=A0A6P8ZH93_THRPL|nr:adenylate cyclase type 3-like [Thrips palmi]
MAADDAVSVSGPADKGRPFSDPSLERLYQSYSVKQKRAGVQCFLAAAVLYDVFVLVLPGQSDPLTRGLTAAFLGLNLALLAWTLRPSRLEAMWAAVPYVAWFLAITQLLAHLFLRKHEGTGRDALGWALLLDYLLYVTLPLRLRYCVLLSIATCGLYVVTVYGLAYKNDGTLVAQLVANAVLLAASNVLGLTSYSIMDKQQRRAFEDTRKSLKTKLVIEEQSAEQERLLLSVLPEHVAVQMREDLGSGLDTQFKKIYMSRHENVSILYADIVGFTAISSTYNALDLVKILNELFARFDRLSEKYQQLRIKILGDCYYCISGAPIERPDHAILCVHMGLSMVEAIKYVQQTTNSPVDMRVGIHTGAVLAGVLGQRQWQFDVYSKDVELANKMESSGMAGKVHVSNKTLGFLDGAFETERAYGEKREEMLRAANITTYFITKILKPYAGENNEPQNGGVTEDPTHDAAKGDDHFNDETRVLAETGRDKEDSEDFKKRLRKELMSRDGQKDLSNATKLLTLAFVDSKKEQEYQYHKETNSSMSIVGCPIALVLTTLAQMIVLPRDTMNIMSFILGIILLVLFTICIVGEALPKAFPSALVRCSESMNSTLWVRRFLAIVVVLVLGAANVVDMVSCSVPAQANCTDYEGVAIPANGSVALPSTAAPNAPAATVYTVACTGSTPGQTCLFPSYFSYFCVLVLVASSLPAQLSHLVKVLLLSLVALAHCAMNVLVVGTALDQEERGSYASSLVPSKFTLSGVLVVVTIALGFLCRHMEKALRVLFLWRTEVEEQREFAADMRQRNEALVYNILPQHVAAHFLRQRTRQHEELYADSFAEVGVLFASMPNFSEFYSEESVNNQGLECLRFLNEVISDFDALLEWPQFQDIIKIKTIGSTYMAASGINPTKKVKDDDPVTVRWAHLALLVEFAFELKKALQSVNEQSFNHFVLKMGINHGPITAGVIGARKPHYDIWGNTVNVASRMESTGRAGCIQVTEETCNILRNFGYNFEQRGMVSVKGKGQLMTYYLTGKGGGGGSIRPDGDGASSGPGSMALTPQAHAPPLASPGALSGHSGTAMLPGPDTLGGGLGGGLSGGLGVQAPSPTPNNVADDEDDGDPAESAKLLEGVRITMPEESSPAKVDTRTPSETHRLLDQA